ncbi:expressed unknown protein [Seminavis robusta]|uniref:Uncharacterized protein n=1 Tax=Seminavis robusta TaxID=568900 RepID=A0A9N8EP31_9STRA|nr:expressed unknown protein [Seminavis robusta]|eukprot:Sro1669_g289920.1 n/a (458) ;mRNA; f:10464-11837
MKDDDAEQRRKRQEEETASPPSFWSFLVQKAFLLDEDVERQMPLIQARIRRSATRAVGVGYEWVTEPEKCTIEWPASLTQNHRSSRYFWYGHDHLFRGLSATSVAFIKGCASSEEHASTAGAASQHTGTTGSAGGFMPGIVVEEDNYFERVEHIQESSFTNRNDPLIEGLLPSCQFMEGTYDIIYYGGEYKYFLRHHRTARGTLTLKTASVVQQPTDTQGQQPTDANTSANATTNTTTTTTTTTTTERHVLQGTVEMDPQMSEEIDVVPYGGNFSFVETDRYQRMVTRKHIHRTTPQEEPSQPPTAAGVVSLKVTSAPTELLPMRYGGQITPNVFVGEMKLLRQEMAIGLLQDCPQPWGESKARDNVTRSSTPATANRSVADCQTMMQKRKDTCLLWMRRHLSILPPEVVVRIDEFVSPPPFFFLQQDDVVLSVDWSGGLPSYSAHSCLIARRRRSS